MTTSELTRRLLALESKAGAQAEAMTIYLTAYRQAGQPEARVRLIACGAQRWQQQEGETAEALRQRAARECERNAWGIALLSECTASSPEQTAPELTKNSER